MLQKGVKLTDRNERIDEVEKALQMEFDRFCKDEDKLIFLQKGDDVKKEYVDISKNKEFNNGDDELYHAWNSFKSNNEKEIDRINAKFGLNIETDHLNLSDKMFLEALYKIKDIVNKKDFHPTSYSCEETGYKETKTNCGMCNQDELTTKENSLFPEQFPERRSLRYRKQNQQCPFDMRKESESNGCYYSCYVFMMFKYEKKNRGYDINRMKEMVKDRIQEVEGRVHTETLPVV